ncbi:MAG: preprotein translocase subunit YajC [bacterium]|nr:preprotein translocase subunit YajC [bacterium]
MIDIVYAMATQPSAQKPSLFSAFVPIILIFLVFFFLVSLPQRKERKARREMLANLKKNDKVITSGGIHGVIMEVKEETVILRIAKNTDVEFSKQGIIGVKSESNIR